MLINFEGKVAVVTGGAKGIGGSTATRFLEDGAHVVILDVDIEEGQKRADAFPETGTFIKCDVSKSSEVAIAFDRIADKFGGVDYLVNNAGIQRYSTVTETSDEEWDLVMNVNLKSAFLCARSAIPLMIGRGGGVVVNVSSVQALHSQANVAPYTTSKTAMLGLTRSIAVDYAPNVRCVAICPGTVDTPMMAWAASQSPDPEAVYREVNEMHLPNRIASPDEIADLILYACSDRAGFMTGQPIRIDGGLGIILAGSKKDS
jgi:NAD(P)-dependent dehydrogenase (short-subunit alcohol dehydrogenase family)